MRARILFARVLDAPGVCRQPFMPSANPCCAGSARSRDRAALSVMDERDSEEMLSQARGRAHRARSSDRRRRVLARGAGRRPRTGEENFAELMAALASDRARLARIFAISARRRRRPGSSRRARRRRAKRRKRSSRRPAPTAPATARPEARGLGVGGNRQAPNANWRSPRGSADPAPRRAATFDDYRDVFLTFAKTRPGGWRRRRRGRTIRRPRC